MYTLDTNSIIYYSKGEEQVVRVMDEIFIRQSILYISAVSEIELFGFPALTAKETESIEQFLRAVMIITLDSRIARVAGELRRQYRVKTIDSAIAATALVTGSTLLTRNQKDFRRIPHLQLQNI